MKLKKLPKRRTPVYGFASDITPNGEGYFWLQEKQSNPNDKRFVIADRSAWKAVPKKRIKIQSEPIYAYAVHVFNDRILPNGDGNIVCKANNVFKMIDIDGTVIERNHSWTAKVVIADTRYYRIVRKNNVKPLKPISKTGVPTPHKSHRMTKWRTEPRSPNGGEPRFYGVRNCTKCGHEQMTHPAGRFSDQELSVSCVPH